MGLWSFILNIAEMVWIWPQLQPDSPGSNSDNKSNLSEHSPGQKALLPENNKKNHEKL